MKIIEALKKIKANKEKITDLQAKIAANSAKLNIETSAYPDPRKQISEWAQACDDLVKDNVELLIRIQKTNLATTVPIVLDGRSVTKTIAEWVWRRREYANVDLKTYQMMTDRGLREGQGNSSTGIAVELKIERHYDPIERDKKIALYRSEPHEIDAALEVINAVTDLL